MSDESYATRTLQRVNAYLSDCYQRAESDDTRAQFDNLGSLYHWLTEAVAAQSREFHHYVHAAMDAESQRDAAREERDELQVRVDDLTADLSAARDEVTELAEAIARLHATAGPTEVVLPDGGTAVLS